MFPPLTPNAWLRYDVLRRVLKHAQEGASFLEIGCGMGALGTALAQRFDYVGYEPDASSFARAAERLRGQGQVHNRPLPETPDRQFDWVGAFEVLEHCEDDGSALAGWYSWVKPGGVLLLSVPAHPHRFGPHDRGAGHFRRYSRQSLRRVIENAGFTAPVISAYGGPLGYALEFVRNCLAARQETEDKATATRASGRWYQPTDQLRIPVALATIPFQFLQRPLERTDLGTGFIALASRPA